MGATISQTTTTAATTNYLLLTNPSGNIESETYFIFKITKKKHKLFAAMNKFHKYFMPSETKKKL